MPSKDKAHDLAAGLMDRLACYTTSDERGQGFDIEAIALDLITMCVLAKIPRQELHKKIDELWTRIFGN